MLPDKKRAKFQAIKEAVDIGKEEIHDLILDHDLSLNKDQEVEIEETEENVVFLHPDQETENIKKGKDFLMIEEIDLEV